MNDFDRLLEQAINPLHRIILIANALVEMQEIANKDNLPTTLLPELTLPYSNHFTLSHYPCTTDGDSIYPSKELAGVAGLYRYLQENNYTVIFANDFSYDIHGIDAVAIHKNTGKILICEAKGTSLAKIKSFSSYLKKTKHKGRQLSNEWCWTSLVDFAFQGPTAGIFLQLLSPMINYEADRLLTVSQLNTEKNGFTVIHTKTWSEAEMQSRSWFAKPYVLTKQHQWLDEITKHSLASATDD